MGFLLAESIVFGPASGIAALVTAFLVALPTLGIGGAIGAVLMKVLGNRKAPTPPATSAPSSAEAGNIQMLAGRAGQPLLKRFAKLIEAIHKKDSPAIVSTAHFLHEQAEDAGGFENLFERFVHERVPVLLSKPEDRQELLTLIGKIEGVDLVKTIEQAKTKPLPVATPIVGLLAFVLCLTMGNSAMAISPERFIPQFRPAVVDPPIARPKAPARSMNRLQKIYSELGRPQGSVGYHFESRGGCECGEQCYCGPACNCGQYSSSRGASRGFWQRGPARRWLSGAGRFVARRVRRGC